MNKAEQARQVAWRLRILRHADNGERQVSRTCRYFGISRKTFYKWRKRFMADGEAALCDRHRRPRRSPNAFSADIVAKILYLRENYHFGPGRIADYLRRFHAIAIAVSSVHRVLQRHGMNRLPASQKHRAHAKRWQRYEKPQPGHRLSIIFDDGAQGVVNVRDMVQFTGVFQPLRDPAFFKQVKVNSELGTLYWPNDADLDSDVLYAKVTGVPIPEYLTARKWPMVSSSSTC
jgi:transposase